MTARTSFGLLVATLVLAAPAGAQTRSPDLPPELFEPLAPDRASAAGSSSGLPIALAVAALVLVALAGFVIGERMPALVRPRSRFVGCWIGVWRSGRTAEFRAIVGDGDSQWVVGRSPVFPAPPTGPLPDDGPARAAHDELLARLRALGWEPAGGETDIWYRLRLEQRAVRDRLAVKS
jgi:hypothetical protein